MGAQGVIDWGGGCQEVVMSGERRPRSFGEALRAARGSRMTLRELARHTHYSHGYLSKVERGIKPVTEDLARRCDEALGMDGVLDEAASVALAESAAVLTDVPRPVQLPAGPATVLGRTPELRRMRELLIERAAPAGTPPLVVLHGVAGVGKTALALRWAHQNQTRFADGVLFADLRGHDLHGKHADPADVLAGFLYALGIPPDRVPEPLEHRESLFRSVLADQRVLVLLDDAHDADQVRPLLPGSAHCPVLLTSRLRLWRLAIDAGAVHLALTPLTPAESVALIASVIGRYRAAREPEAVATVAARCAQLPLNVRVAAEQIAACPDVPVAELVSSLGLLDGSVEPTPLPVGGSLQESPRSPSVTPDFTANCGGEETGSPVTTSERNRGRDEGNSQPSGRRGARDSRVGGVGGIGDDAQPPADRDRVPGSGRSVQQGDRPQVGDLAENGRVASAAAVRPIPGTYPSRAGRQVGGGSDRRD